MSATQIADFFAWRFADLRPAERIEIRSFPRGGGKTHQSWHKTPTAAARAVLALPEDHDPYYGVNARRDQGGKKEDVTQVRGLWADQDFKHYPDGAAGADAALAACPLRPTAVVETGNGYHLYWQLPTPIEPTEDVEQLLLRLYAFLGGVDGPLDSVQDLPRVLRVPFTRNHKSDPPRPVMLKVADTGARYTLDDFEWILPAPAPRPRPTWTPPTGRATRATNQDAPTHDDVREWLRFTPPQRTYKEWLTTLAAVHSIFPGGDGIALCEEWSTGKPGEVAEKFASFKRTNGASNTAGVGTLVHTAKQNGWAPPRQAEAASAGTSPDYQRLLAERDALIVTLRTDVARLGDQVRATDRELAEVREERDFYRLCLDCPDPVVGRALPVLAEEVHRRYQAGAPLVQDGHEFVRLNFERAAEGKVINRGALATAAERLGPATPHLTRPATVRRNGKDEPTTHHYYACPVEERTSVARLGLGLLARAKPQGRHAGRKPPKVMPPAVAAQTAPVRREQQHIERFYSLRDETKLATVTTTGVTDYWTPDGEQITREAACAWQVAHGVRAAAVETQQHHHTPPSRLFVGERPPARPVVASQPPGSTVEFQPDPLNVKSAQTQQQEPAPDVAGAGRAPARELLRPPLGRADFDAWLDEEPAPIPITGARCQARGCGKRPGASGYCERHDSLLAMAAGD